MQAKVLGEVAAEQMKAIEESLDEGEVQVVCSVVGIQGPNGEQTVRFRANCPPPVQMQLLAAAQQGLAVRLAQDGTPED
jgi:hypothetical protein